MEPALVWLLLGLGLIAVEMMSGTFYLLILGAAALIGALAGYLGAPFAVQAVLAAIAAITGVLVLRRRKNAGPAVPARDNQMDIGQTAVIESWLSQPQRLARARYRNTTWDAEVLGDDRVEIGAVLYVAATDGNRLKLSSTRPS
jgi:membrane protein implicated in regulation of membrane protease activity